MLHAPIHTNVKNTHPTQTIPTLIQIRPSFRKSITPTHTNPSQYTSTILNPPHTHHTSSTSNSIFRLASCTNTFPSTLPPTHSFTHHPSHPPTHLPSSSNIHKPPLTFSRKSLLPTPQPTFLHSPFIYLLHHILPHPLHNGAPIPTS